MISSGKVSHAVLVVPMTISSLLAAYKPPTGVDRLRSGGDGAYRRGQPLQLEVQRLAQPARIGLDHAERFDSWMGRGLSLKPATHKKIPSLQAN